MFFDIKPNAENKGFHVFASEEHPTGTKFGVFSCENIEDIEKTKLRAKQQFNIQFGDEQTSS